MTIRPQIDARQFQNDMETLAQIGRRPDGAVHRVAYSPTDLEARQWLHGRLRGIDLRPQIDPAGNSTAVYPGRDPNLPPIAIGSHTDTVPMGGAYDGALGTVAALAVVEALHTAGHKLAHPLLWVNFAAEEATMAGGTTGSQAMSGLFDSAVLDKAAWDGRPVRDHLQAADLDPDRIADAVRPSGAFAAFVELHIEQSTRLETADLPIAVVDGFVGIRRYAVAFRGQANHAGTTPMSVRRDALIMAAPLIHFVRDVAEELNIVGTIGDFTVRPGAPNVIPEAVDLVVEIRGLDTAVLEQAEAAVAGEVKQLGGTFDPIVRKPPVQTDPLVRDAIAVACGRLGLEHLIMPSGAGHDAMNMHRLARTGLFFVPSRHGISHSKEEYTSPADCLNGAQVLLETVSALDTMLSR